MEGWDAHPVKNVILYSNPGLGLVYNVGSGVINTGDRIFNGTDEETGRALGNFAGELAIDVAAAAVASGISKAVPKVKPKAAGAIGVVDDVVESGLDAIELSNSNIQHIKKHTFAGMTEQAKYLTDEQLANKLDNTSFFNKDWTQSEIIQYTQEAYNALRGQGKTGLQSIQVNGETINVFIKSDGTFDTAYGVYKYTVDDFR